MEKPKMMFTENAIWFILSALNKELDANGYVICKFSNEKILDVHGFPFKAKEVIGIMRNDWITERE